MIQEIIKIYKNKSLPNYKICEKYSISNKKLIKLLKENNIYKKDNYKTISEEKYNYIIKNYYNQSNLEIAQTLNISKETIWNVVKKEKLNLKGSGSKINLFLDKIDKNSEIFSYFLGWLQSDGNIQNKKRNYRCTISIKDESIIDLFHNYFKGSKKYIVNKTNGIMYNLVICNKIFIEYLVSLGLTPNKSKTIQMKNFEFNSHFVRGVFDGDGSVRNPKIFPNRLEAKFTTSSVLFMEQMVNYLNNNNIKTTICKNGKCNNIVINGYQNFINFYEFLYKDSKGLLLERKHFKFAALISNYKMKNPVNSVKA